MLNPETANHPLVVANTFTEMQTHRHTADYDSGVQWSRTDAIALTQSVAKAFESWEAIREEPAAQNFLVTLLLRER